MEKTKNELRTVRIPSDKWAALKLLAARLTIQEDTLVTQKSLVGRAIDLILREEAAR